jgi:hypothetical protein
VRKLTLLRLILIFNDGTEVRGSRPHELKDDMSRALKAFHLDRNDVSYIEMFLETLNGSGVLNDARDSDVQTAVDAHLLVVFNEGLHENPRLHLRLMQNVLVHEGVLLELRGFFQDFLVDRHRVEVDLPVLEVLMD